MTSVLGILVGVVLVTLLVLLVRPAAIRRAFWCVMLDSEDVDPKEVEAIRREVNERLRKDAN